MLLGTETEFPECPHKEDLSAANDLQLYPSKSSRGIYMYVCVGRTDSKMAPSDLCFPCVIPAFM